MIYDWITSKSNDLDTLFETKIESNKPIRILEKDKFGEVNTPSILINELLDNLPKNIWTNPELTWLDPAAGTGNFPMMIYYRLFTSLAKHFPNKKTRHNHIIEKMLYMVEINPSSAKELYEIFGPNANIYKHDFLLIDSSKSRFLDKYDIIIGNPPYQTTKTKKYVGSVGNKTLWDKFILKSFEMLASDGFLAFITPNSWRRPESKLYEIMTKEHQLLFLHIYGKKDGLEIFKAQTRFDCYIITGNAHTASKPILLIDEKGIVHKDFDIASWPFLPNYNFANIKKLLTKPGEHGYDVLYDSSMYDARKLTKNKTKKFKYPIVHTITKKGLGLRYSQKRPEKKAKVLLNFNELQYPYNDYKGEYGMSQLTFGLPIKSKGEGDKIVKMINSPMFKEIIKATKWSSFQTDYRMFKQYRKPTVSLYEPSL
jgi:hypothetical protein